MREKEAPKRHRELVNRAVRERFSARWAPIDAPNDPTGLNRYHASNLIRLVTRYTDLAVTALEASIPPLPDPHA